VAAADSLLSAVGQKLLRPETGTVAFFSKNGSTYEGGTKSIANCTSYPENIIVFRTQRCYSIKHPRGQHHSYEAVRYVCVFRVLDSRHRDENPSAVDRA
jgi:hypothetical protein